MHLDILYGFIQIVELSSPKKNQKEMKQTWFLYTKQTHDKNKKVKTKTKTTNYAGLAISICLLLLPPGEAVVGE